MLRPQHELAGLRGGAMTSRRMASIAFVGALHIVLIYALMNGLAQKIVSVVPHDIVAHIVETPQQQPALPPPPVQIAKVQPTEQPAIEPVIDIQTPPAATAIQSPPPQPTTAIANSGASGLTNTHTTPPYPPDARRLGQQGTVVLQITIAANGAVTDAKVATSSGTPALDQTAVAWVMSHWKYKPAIANGAPTQSVTQAAVKFDLKQAH
ncbi:MAG TPA: energy transducer TonB [Rhizomicrobium sp.]|nr:energy transducer TonB [Rhizomicrobium sp.]